ncbi:MAG: C40 family peptidase [Acidimicrobiia bacterium]
MTAVSDVMSTQTRIAELQSMLATIEGKTPVATASGTAAAGSTGFDDVLAGVGGGSEQQVVATAKEYLGVPYVYGGTDPAVGLDCSGFVQLVYRRMGVELPRVTYDQVRSGQPVSSLAEARPGDLIFSVGDRGQRVNGHVGIYLGNGKWIVAPRTGDVVKIADVPREITAIRRVLPGATSSGGGW